MLEKSEFAKNFPSKFLRFMVQVHEIVKVRNSIEKLLQLTGALLLHDRPISRRKKVDDWIKVAILLIVTGFGKACIVHTSGSNFSTLIW